MKKWKLKLSGNKEEIVARFFFAIERGGTSCEDRLGGSARNCY